MSFPPNAIQGMIKTDLGNDIPVLGYIVWWNVEHVKCTRDWFKDKLNFVGLDGDRYAREHNFRNTYIRCLGALEEQRIIRKVKETQQELIYQFTAEKLIDDPSNPRLEYTPETTVVIDKESYLITEDFASALKCDDRLRPILIAMFEEERKTYRSNDLTRYIQRILSDNADIVPLRQQGSIYFVPAVYHKIIEQITDVLQAVPTGNARMDCVPVPDVSTSRNMVGNAVEAEIAEIFAKMEKEITDMHTGSSEITEKWVDYRLDKISKIQDRLTMYSAALGEASEKLGGKFLSLKQFLKPRKLEL